MSVACVIIAGGTRTDLLDREVIPSVVAQGFDEIVVCGEHHDGQGYRYLPVAALTHSTVDALVKRDAGTVGTNADWIAYLSDDHRFVGTGGGRVIRYRASIRPMPDVNIPHRLARHPEHGLIRIPNGETEGYCAGHCGIFSRAVVRDRPWSSQPHHRNWDVLASRNQVEAGFSLAEFPWLAVEDLEPEAQPWL